MIRQVDGRGFVCLGCVINLQRARAALSEALIKTLKSLHLKKGRAETGLFLAEGARVIAIWTRLSLAARRESRPLRSRGRSGTQDHVESSKGFRLNRLADQPRTLDSGSRA